MDSRMQQQHPQLNMNNSSSPFLSDQLGRANEFINSLTETEISALNASYSSSSSSKNNHNNNTAPTSSSVVPTMRSESSSIATSTNDAFQLLPTPIGGSCQVVSTKDQVPLNQSLISQSHSLLFAFQKQEQLQDHNFNNNSSSLDTLFPNLVVPLTVPSSFPVTASNKHHNKITEADFGATTSSSSPLIVAAAAASVPKPRSNALQFNFNSSMSALSSSSVKLAAAAFSQHQSQDFAHHHHLQQQRPQHHRSQQSTRWNERYQELILYKREHGDCNVPYLWEKNRPLSEWVKRQRHQYKLKKESKHSALTDEREALLSNLGFVWNSRASLWDGRYQELVSYYKKFGNLKVSKRTPQHRALSVWLKRQRHACRLFLSGDPSTCMTEERMQKLLDLGVKIHKKS